MTTNNTKTNGTGLKSLYLKEDWWAVWIGLGTVIIGIILWLNGTTLSNITVSFKQFSDWSAMPGMVAPLLPKLLILYVVLAVVFTIAMKIMGREVGKFIAGFTALYVLAIVVQILASWELAATLNLEAPVMALIVV